ncbi:MAG: hypothetical protein A2X59_13235 [Nitrospirae bacterium GWC2_42_7]|nr:MAG: hypothetical protein A2X59_13235 [Nitrospirae bacterium GWC2_42_7]
MASSSHLKPGEKGKISVSVNNNGKSGNISKTIQIYTNNPKKPVTTISVAMRVKDRFHINKSEAKEIFNGECKSCHTDRGIGKKGLELFMADCIMCHERGKSAIPITEMQSKPKEYLIKSTADGVTNTSMPGWHLKNNGPLSDEEIESLVHIIKRN